MEKTNLQKSFGDLKTAKGYLKNVVLPFANQSDKSKY
jgi:hypothetical protein